MPTNTNSLTSPFSPLDLQSRSRLWQVGAIALGTVFLALSSYVEVPMIPVPMTMQTFAVAMVGALYGWRLGALTIAAWLAEAIVGLPVLAGGASGIQHFIGPTAGYLLAFPICGALTGWLAERGWNGRNVVMAFVSMLLSNLLCLALGGAWLATVIGVGPAIESGVTPFVLGSLLKSVLGAAILKATFRDRGQAAQ